MFNAPVVESLNVFARELEVCVCVFSSKRKRFSAFSFSVQNLYDSIKSEPFKIPEDDGNDLTHTFFNPDREGWLLKLG